MNLNEAILKRRSIRAYKDTPVDPDLMRRIFSEAQASPSNCNTQPWHVVVVSGEVRDAVEQKMMEDLMSGNPPANVFKPGDKDLKDEYRKRQVDCAISLYDAMGVKFEERDKRQQLMARNWQFFGAPHGAFISMRKDMSEVNAVDVGIYLQTLMLLMTTHGIGSCPQGALAAFPDAAYQIAGVPEDHGILCGLSFGYPQEDAAINNYDVGRAELDSNVVFLG